MCKVRVGGSICKTGEKMENLTELILWWKKKYVICLLSWVKNNAKQIWIAIEKGVVCKKNYIVATEY